MRKTLFYKYTAALLTISLLIVLSVSFVDDTATIDHASAIEIESGMAIDSRLLEIMKDAPEQETTFAIKAAILTDYIVEQADIYLFDAETNAISLVGDSLPIMANVVDFKFDAIASHNTFALLKLTYGPNFSFERDSEAVCLIKFVKSSIYDEFYCDPLSTAEYLIAAAMIEVPPEDIFSPAVVTEAISVSALPRNTTYERYLAIHQLFFAHVAENTDYMVVSQSGQYLDSMYLVTLSFSHSIRQFRRLTVSMIDDAAESVDKSMVNLTYRIYMTLDSLLLRHSHRLTKISENNQLIRDFFTGLVPFIMAGAESDVVVDVRQEDDVIRLNYWPWFTGIKVQFDDQEKEIISKAREFSIPPKSEFVDFTAISNNGRYPTIRFGITVDDETASTNLAQLTEVEHVDP